MYFEVRETQSELGTSRTGHPVGTGYQSDWAPSRDWVPVGLGTQSGLGTSRTGHPVGTGYQSDWAPSRDWVPVGLRTQSGLGTQSDWAPSRTAHPVGTGCPVRLGDRSDWYPVTQSGTGTGASLRKYLLHITTVSFFFHSQEDLARLTICVLMFGNKSSSILKSLIYLRRLHLSPSQLIKSYIMKTMDSCFVVLHSVLLLKKFQNGFL